MKSIAHRTILVLIFGLVPIVGFAIYGVGGASGSSSGPSGAEPSVVIGYENLGATPEMVVITKAWFQKYMHAHVTLQEFSSGPDALTALAAGSLQFMTEIGNPPVSAAISRGIPLDVIWNDESFTQGEGLVVRNQAGITSLRDLKGKKIAVVSGSSSDYVFSAALRKAGVSKSSITLVNVSPPSMLSAWLAGSIDGAYVWTPTLNQLAAHKGKIIFPDADASSYAPSVNVSVVNRSWAASHATQVQQFIEAQNAGVQFTLTHKTEALKVMAQGAGISVSLAKTELAGIEFFSASEQLSHGVLGAEGSPASASTVGLGLDSALTFLESSGLASAPNGGAKPSASINRNYVTDLLKHTP